MQEEEGAILPDGATNLAAISVISPFRILYRSSGWIAKSIVAEPFICIYFIVLVIPVARAMPLIGASFCNHLNFSASGTGEISSSVVGGDAEFFQAPDRCGNPGPRSGLKTGVVPAATLHV